MHVPVLKKEVIQYLNPNPNENFIDCTVGEGGHAIAILKETGPNGKILGIEADTELYQKLKLRLAECQIKKRFILVNNNFVNLKETVEKENFKDISGILFDLGLSSWHLEESKRGFSFLREEPLDMRYAANFKLQTSNFKFPNPDFQAQSLGQEKESFNNHRSELTAETIVNQYPEKEIEKILREYGQEKFSKRIAKEIVEIRKITPLKTTFQLVEVIKKAVPEKYKRQKIHFATRTFQAFRIVVNDELKNLKTALPQALEILKPKGRLVIISFHSLEDRIVKNFFLENKNSLQPLTKKPIRPTDEEIKINPRSRSAKLRAAIRI